MKVAIRVDASRTIGAGHWFRCRALADELAERGARVTLICRPLPGFSLADDHCAHPIAPLPDEVDHQAHLESGDEREWLGVAPERDAEQTVEALQALGGVDWLINDHYGLDSGWQAMVRRRARRILSLDDRPWRRHDCDILLDQNWRHDHGRTYLPLVPDGANLLIGPEHALLRIQFRRARKELEPRDGSVRRVLIAFGGIDADDITGSVLQALSDLHGRRFGIDVVVGGAYPHERRLDELAGRMGDVRIFRNISDMAARMAEADLAIGGGGTTSWERCCLGLPAIVATLALNQASINRALEKDGLVIHLGTLDHIRPRDWGVAIEAAIGDRRRLADMSRRTMELVDGLGAARVADAMERME